MKTLYKIWQVDAWADLEDMWTYNQTFYITEFASASKDIGRAAKNALSKLGITFEKNKTFTEYDANGDCWEILEKGTYCPLFLIRPVEN